MTAFLEIDGLTKVFRHPWTYRSLSAVTDIRVTLREGEIFGLIGHNGAGKTTTFKLLLGFLRPTCGRALFLGRPSASTWARRQIGFLPEQPYFYDHLSVRETLDFYAGLYGMHSSQRATRVRHLAERLMLDSKLDQPVRSLSKGTLQRVGIAQSILHSPKLVILDEPMSGLDPIGRKDMRDLIHSLKRDGTTVIFSSHILPDAEALCDRVGILVRGTIRDVVDLRQPEEREAVSFRLDISGVDTTFARTLPGLGANGRASGSERVTITLPDREGVRRTIELVHARGGQIESLTPVSPSLEDRFLSYVRESDAAD